LGEGLRGIPFPKEFYNKEEILQKGAGSPPFTICPVSQYQVQRRIQNLRAAKTVLKIPLTVYVISALLLKNHSVQYPFEGYKKQENGISV
jgi:hypothetical protein